MKCVLILGDGRAKILTAILSNYYIDNLHKKCLHREGIFLTNLYV
jgi:hypothetical protein